MKLRAYLKLRTQPKLEMQPKLRAQLYFSRIMIMQQKKDSKAQNPMPVKGLEMFL